MIWHLGGGYNFDRLVSYIRLRLFEKYLALYGISIHKEKMVTNSPEEAFLLRSPSPRASMTGASTRKN